MAGEFINELKKWAAELARRRADGDEIGLNRAVELISRNFSVRPHEVAIFALTPEPPNAARTRGFASAIVATIGATGRF